MMGRVRRPLTLCLVSLFVCVVVAAGCTPATPSSAVPAQAPPTATADHPESTGPAPVIANFQGTIVVDVGTSVTVLDKDGPLLEIVALQVVPAAPDALTQPGRIALEVLVQYRFLRQRDDLIWGAIDWTVAADVAGMPVQASAAIPWLGSHAAGQGAGRTASGWIRVDAPATGPIRLIYGPPQPGAPSLTTFAIRLRNQ